MCNAWNHPPGCTCGFGGEGHLGGGWGGGRSLSTGYLNQVTHHAYKYEDQDFCRPTHCPYCREEVYFIRHNGGSVWIDELGWPWPKHACFYEQSQLEVNTTDISTDLPTDISAEFSPSIYNIEELILGLVVREGTLFTSDSYTCLAIKCRDKKGRCIAITRTKASLLGSLVLLDLDLKRLYSGSTSHKIWFKVSPRLFGLSNEWSENQTS